jgi:TolB-like protein
MDAQALIAELKRRRVFRVVIGYGVVTFALLQVIEPVMHGLHMPEVTLTYAVVLLALGFPVAVILAWAFDVNAGRVEREPPSPGFRGVKLPLALAGIGLIAAIPAAGWYFLRKRPAPVEARVSIAVLPFANLSGDPAQDYLSEGITEEILSKLSSLRGLAVASRTGVARFKATTEGPREIGAALGVEWLLEGSVRHAGDRIRVTTTLFKSADGFQSWSEDSEVKLDDIFAVQERIAARTVDALALKLTSDERRSLADWGTRNAAAYDEYLQGQVLFENYSNREQFQAGLAHFQRALAIDPRFAPAMAGMASIEATHYRDYGGDPASLAHAEELAGRALTIDPKLGRALLALGDVRIARYDYAGAAEVAARVTETEPENYVAWDLLCLAEGYRTPPRAIEAEQACRRSLRINPWFASTQYHLARALLKLGKIEEASRAMASLDERQPNSVLSRDGHFWLEMYEGRPREAMAALSRMDATPLDLSWRAMAHGQLGEMDQAFADLEGALAGGYRDVGELQTSSWFTPLRKDPRFAQAMKKPGIEP